MGRSSAAVVFVVTSAALVFGSVLGILAAFPDFFSHIRAESVAIGSVVGWCVMLVTFLFLLYTVDKGPNAFLGGYVAGFLLRLLALGVTAGVAQGSGRHPLAFVLMALVSSYFVLFIVEAGILSRLDTLRNAVGLHARGEPTQ
jgi:hypothetical protein